MASFSVLTSSFASAKKQAEVEKRIRSIRNSSNRVIGESCKSANNSPMLQRRSDTSIAARSCSPKLYRQLDPHTISNNINSTTKSGHKEQHHSSSLKLASSSSSPRQRKLTMDSRRRTDDEEFMMYRACSRYNRPRRSISAPTLAPLTALAQLPSQKSSPKVAQKGKGCWKNLQQNQRV